MLRREFLWLIVPGSLAPRLLLSQQSGPAPPPPAPVPWTLGLNPATPLTHTVAADAVATTELHFFSPAQMATLTRLSDVLLPPLSAMPGALEAEAPAFLDFLIGSSAAPRKQLYLEGLDWLEREAQTRYRRSFKELTGEQIDPMLRPWLRTWMTDHPPQESHADFINIAHADIRTATVNSKRWSDAPISGASERTPVALYWLPIEPDLGGNKAACAAAPAVDAPKSEHTLPTYPR